MKSLIPTFSLIVVSVCILTGNIFAQTNEDSEDITRLSADVLEAIKSVELSENWKYHSGDDMTWAEPDFDDSSWKSVDTRLNWNNLPEDGWNGIGWFRLHLIVESKLLNKPLALNLNQSGASEIYLDGEKIYEFGVVGTSETEMKGYSKPEPKSIVFDDGTEHVIAVRYSNFSLDPFHKVPIGFRISLEELNYSIERRTSFLNKKARNQMFFVGIPIALAFIHLLLFLFYPRAKINLYFVIFAGSIAAFIFLSYWIPAHQSHLLTFFLTYIGGARISLILAITFGMLIEYSIFYTKLPKQFWFFVIAWVGYGAITLIKLPIERSPVVNLFVEVWPFVILFGSVAEILRVNLVAIIRRKYGAWFIAIASISFVISFIGSTFMGGPMVKMNQFLSLGFGIFIISISMHLAQSFVRTSKKLEQVNAELEEKNREAQQELEDARKVQMSLMPDKVPLTEGLEIAGKCLPANTVSGDFFNYLPGKHNSEIMVVIADVTGKAMKGAMNAVMTDGILHAKLEEIEENVTPAILLSKINNVLNARMERYMNVTMQIGQIDTFTRTLTLANAGHHALPVLLREGEVQFLEARGFPLGVQAGFEYDEKHFQLKSRDIVVFMTDGIIEARNSSDELFYSESGRLEEVISQFTPERRPEEMVDELIADVIDFSGAKAVREDDMTVIVGKIL